VERNVGRPGTEVAKARDWVKARMASAGLLEAA
jgi:hypothetical protein